MYKPEKSIKSIYIHIPFCKDKCYYCNFISFNNKNNYILDYKESLIKEIKNTLKYSNNKIETIYIGGGTPSVIDYDFYFDILNVIKSCTEISKNCEITFELNPSTVTYEYLKDLRSLGINRLSIGIQSFNDNLLKKLNRKHTSSDAFDTVNIAKKAGFDNISIDLMYGLPAQDMSVWIDTLNKAIKTDVRHISAYGLKIEENTFFGKNTPEVPDEDLCADMYIKAIEILEKNGFYHYEISNFCKKGFESKHNLTYWKNQEYYGFGLAAHGYLKGERYSNIENLEEYITNPLKRADIHKVSFEEDTEEAIFLGLRLRTGISLNKFKSKYGFDIEDRYKNILKKHIESDFISIENGYLRLTIKGVLLSNNILADFLVNKV